MRAERGEAREGRRERLEARDERRREEIILCDAMIKAASASRTGARGAGAKLRISRRTWWNTAGLPAANTTLPSSPMSAVATSSTTTLASTSNPCTRSSPSRSSSSLPSLAPAAAGPDPVEPGSATSASTRSATSSTTPHSVATKSRTRLYSAASCGAPLVDEAEEEEDAASAGAGTGSGSRRYGAGTCAACDAGAAPAADADVEDEAESASRWMTRRANGRTTSFRMRSSAWATRPSDANVRRAVVSSSRYEGAEGEPARMAERRDDRSEWRADVVRSMRCGRTRAASGRGSAHERQERDREGDALAEVSARRGGRRLARRGSACGCTRSQRARAAWRASRPTCERASTSVSSSSPSCSRWRGRGRTSRGCAPCLRRRRPEAGSRPCRRRPRSRGGAASWP